MTLKTPTHDDRVIVGGFLGGVPGPGVAADVADHRLLLVTAFRHGADAERLRRRRRLRLLRFRRHRRPARLLALDGHFRNLDDGEVGRGSGGAFRPVWEGEEKGFGVLGVETV